MKHKSLMQRLIKNNCRAYKMLRFPVCFFVCYAKKLRTELRVDNPYDIDKKLVRYVLSTKAYVQRGDTRIINDRNEIFFFSMGYAIFIRRVSHNGKCASVFCFYPCKILMIS